MLVWKLQTLDVNIASVRYRCLFPLHHLSALGIQSAIYSDTEFIEFTAETQAVVFVKSFRAEDVATCQRAHQQGIPIVLDVCDNIFIEEYAIGKQFTPANNFYQMARQATAVITPTAALKAVVEEALSQHSLVRMPLVVSIPDGSESLADIQRAFDLTRKQRWQRWFNQRLKASTIKQVQRRAKQVKAMTRRSIQQTKRLSLRSKCKVSNLLRQAGVLKPKPEMDLSVTAQRPSGALPAVDSTSPRSITPRTACKTQRTPLRPDAWIPAKSGTKTVLWFGNHGAKYGNFGMVNILQAAPALANLSSSIPLRLVVVSNSYEKYLRHIKSLPFETMYLRWHPRKVYDYIRASDVVLVPNSLSPFSVCKSANRPILALSHGTPVVASRTPALDVFHDCILLDDWQAGIETYLTQPEIGQSHVAQAQAVIAAHFSGPVIAQQWQQLLSRIQRSTPAPMAIASANQTP